MAAGIVLGAAWFAAFLAAHIGLFHSRPIHARSAAIAAIFGGCVAGSVASDFVWPGPRGAALEALTSVVLMAACFILYVPFYYTVATSISVVVLIALRRAPGGEMPLAALRDRWVSPAVVEQRLEAMIRSRLLQGEGARLRLTPKGRRVAQAFSGVKDLWKLGPGG